MVVGLESKLTMDWSAGQVLGRLSKLQGGTIVAGIPTALEIAGETRDELTVVVVASLDTKPVADDVTTGVSVGGFEVE